MAFAEGNRFDQLPTSFLHNSLLSLLPVQQSGDSGGISCGLSNKKSVETSLPIVWTAKSFCVVDCVNAHELFRDDAFAGHNLTPIRQFQAQD